MSGSKLISYHKVIKRQILEIYFIGVTKVR